MNIQKDRKNLFKYAILKLCDEVSGDELKHLDQILVQAKQETEILSDLISQFPQFITIYSQVKNAYGTS